MKKKLALAAVVAALGASPGAASAQDVLSGITGLACEAILCLSSSVQPAACAPSLAYYFGLTAKKLVDTISKRQNFLQLCPVASQTPEMQSLVSAIANGAGRCDVQSLNTTLFTPADGNSNAYGYIDNQMPGYCGVYIHHIYTDLNSTAPRYVGTPERGGYWVEAQNYDSALVAYNERIQREDEEKNRYQAESQNGS